MLDILSESLSAFICFAICIYACYLAGAVLVPRPSKKISIEMRVTFAMVAICIAFVAGSYLCSFLPAWAWVSLLVFGICMMLLGMVIGAYRRQAAFIDVPLYHHYSP